MADLDDRASQSDSTPLLEQHRETLAKYIGSASWEGLVTSSHPQESVLPRDDSRGQMLEGNATGGNFERAASAFLWREAADPALKEQFPSNGTSPQNVGEHISPCIELSSTGILHVHASTIRRPSVADTPAQNPAPDQKSGRHCDNAMLQDPVILDVEDDEKPITKPGIRDKQSVGFARPFAVCATFFFLICGSFLLTLAPHKRWAFLEIWRWCFFTAGLAPTWYLCSLLVHYLLIALEAQFFTVHQAVYLAVALKSPMTMLLRMLLLIPLFILAFTDEIERPEDVQLAYMTVLKLLACLVLFTLGNVIKTLLAKLLASNFHRKAFFDKMQDALQKEYFLHALSQPRRHGPLHAAALSNPFSAERQAVQAEVREERLRRLSSRRWGKDRGYVLGESSPHTGTCKVAPTQEAVRLPPLESEDRQWGKRVAQLERHMRENKLRQHMTVTEELGKPQSEWDEVKSTREAKRLAFDIFWNARSDYSRNYIVFEDLLNFLPADKALAAIKVLDGNSDGKVFPSEMRDAVMNIYQERKNLAATLSDTHSVVGKMEATFAAIIHIVLVFFYLAIFQVNVQQVWLTLSSGILAFVFIFGNNIRNLYESSLLLFVVHPFDVGDVCFLDKDQWCQVVEISLQVTTFSRWDGIRIYYPNAKLSSEPILNVSRSANRWEGYKILVDISTPASVFEKVDDAVTALFSANPQDYTGAKLVCANGATDPLKFTLCVFWEYNQPGTDLLRLAKARHRLYLTVSQTLVEADAHYHLPPYEGMETLMMNLGLRPAGEGSKFMPAFLKKPALKV